MARTQPNNSRKTEVTRPRANTGGSDRNRPRDSAFVTLADPQLRSQVDELRRQLSTSPDKAREFLQKAGIFNRSGKLSKRFGG